MSFLLWANRVAKNVAQAIINALTDDNSDFLVVDNNDQLTDDS